MSAASTSTNRSARIETFHPGAYLSDELTARDMRKRDLDIAAGWPIGMTKRIVSGRAPISRQIAERLADVLGTTAELWVSLQAQWDEATRPEVMTAHAWATNAHMLADLLRIMRPPEGQWCDLTYGKGAWWSPRVNPAPADMVRCIGPNTKPVDGAVRTDFRATPFAANQFGVTWFDPPYVLKGTDAQFAEMNEHYGLHAADRELAASRPARTGDRRRSLTRQAPRSLDPSLREAAAIAEMVDAIKLPSGWTAVVTLVDDQPYVDDRPYVDVYRGHLRRSRILPYHDGWGVSARGFDTRRARTLREALSIATGTTIKQTRKQALTDLIIDGMTEAVRITRPGGWVAVKAGRGIDGGLLYPTDDLVARYGYNLGLEQVTSLFLETTPRSQKHRGPQKTPRSNVSRLTVFAVPT